MVQMEIGVCPRLTTCCNLPQDKSCLIRVQVCSMDQQSYKGSSGKTIHAYNHSNLKENKTPW